MPKKPPPRSTPKRGAGGLRLEHRYRFADLLGSRSRITWSVGQRDELVVLSLAGEPDYWKLDRDGGSHPKARAHRPNEFRIHRVSSKGTDTTDLEPTPENFHLVQPIDRGRWLLVRGRTTSDEDENALVFDASGKKVAGFHTGDAVQDVQWVSDDRVWIAYFDENGDVGLECRDLSGEVLLALDDVDGEPLVECFALNAGPEVVLAYTYPDFPVIEIGGDDLEPLVALDRGPVEGARAIAYAPGMLVFASSFEDTSALFVATREDGELRRIPVIDANGEPFEILEATARGSTLWLADATGVAVVDVSKLR